MNIKKIKSENTHNAHTLTDRQMLSCWDLERSQLVNRLRGCVCATHFCLLQITQHRHMHMY